MRCSNCEVYNDNGYGCRAGISSYLIEGALGCHAVDLIREAYHFNQVKDKTRSSTYTRADRIRAMSDKKLAYYLNNVETDGRVYGPQGEAYWLDWLRQEAKI